ncbi:30S ribosomal protein S23 [Nonlabens sp. YIK11]|uniref:four helix bundle protein n=1 Tax=Nonlabens sp. YIK11 TaxID=1453349 RepID=UPI0006DC0AFF|nr:four helix bundle protein [Nonlabens sp. YIK11]KQC33912.1 30S ribosomal protein S23 [Nonlabens sp. YIK11]
MHQFEKLKIWQKAMDLVLDVYKATEQFPKEEKYGLISQMQRSAVSIPSNIAEGSGRNSNQQFNYFLAIASGSTSELITQTFLSEKLINEETAGNIVDQCVEISKMNIALQKSLSKKV